MKRSVQLLTGLFLLVITGLFLAKYELKKQYMAIDKGDIYYAFNAIENLQFSHVKINGGNKSHLTIEPGTSDQLLISKEISEKVTYSAASDTLYINFSESETGNTSDFENHWGNSGHSSVFVQLRHNQLQSVTGDNASISVNLSESQDFETRLTGITNLEIFDCSPHTRSLEVASMDASKFRIVNEGEPVKLDFLALHLSGESFAEIHNIEPDSSLLKMEPRSRISVDALFFKEN